ncbi:carbohydrate-binding module family 21 protein [Russula emetica]|nr:carbohydrate-binding module family 21 protein [Russula emetica]
MALAVLATPARPPTTVPHSRIPGRLASAPSFLRISDAVVPLIHPLPSGVTSTSASSRDIPSAPRQSTPIISSRHSSESHIRTLPAAVAPRSVCMSSLPREKSGEPLKSSLKMRRAHSQGSIPVITDPVNSSSSKNAPAMPAHKGVRFHSQLEHVKLFSTKQKPLAVSRDGYPTDTSGTDSDFPPFIYHGRDDDLKERPLVMHRIDVPTAPPLPEDTRDVVIENIALVGTVVEGTVRVRNIAFEKWIAVRFTLDKWQTTSEVTGCYKESLQNGTFDRFTFSIKLADILSRAEEKPLYLSVRYSVPGREIWDNNSGRNYQVRFVREKALKGNTEAEATVVESREESSRADDIADLRRKLEELVELGCPSKTVSGILAQESRRRCESPSPALSLPLQEATPSFKSEGFPAGRYDFAASSRTPWRPPAVHQTLSPARTLTRLHARTRRGRSFRFYASPVVPPTTSAAEESPSFFPDSDSDDPITPVPSLPSCGRSGSGSRNHTRGGTIVLSHAPGVKRTPPTSPFAGPALSAFPFLPLSASTSAFPQRQPHAYFDSSTPSITSSSLSRSPSTSPSSSPAEPMSPTRLVPPAVPDTDEESDSPIHHFDYHNFVNRYCFYKGSKPGEVLEHSDFIPRSLSASSVEALLSTPYSSKLAVSDPSRTEMGTWDCFRR